MKLNTHSQDSEWLSRCEDFEQSVLKYKNVRFSHFVSPHDLAVFMSSYRLSPDVRYRAFGGSDDAERVILGFYPDFLELSDDEFPILPLTISNIGTLTHRDVLGAVLGLGIKREMVGDIYFDEKHAVLMCEKTASDYILYNLKSIGRQNVEITVCDKDVAHLKRHKFEDLKVFVTSPRLDSVISAVYRFSRSDASHQILTENVNLNFMPCVQSDKKVKEGDVISVRHHGRFLIDGTVGETKKGRIILSVKKYV